MDITKQERENEVREYWNRFRKLNLNDRERFHKLGNLISVMYFATSSDNEEALGYYNRSRALLKESPEFGDLMED